MNKDLAHLGIADYVRALRTAHAEYPRKITLQDPKLQFHFFWRGPFSQWTLKPFKVARKAADGFRTSTFNCMEQYMMAYKALLFNDIVALQDIMSSTSPKDQKAMGRRVRGFDEARWKAVAKDIILVGSCAKYISNGYLRKQLMRTEGLMLVEASPYDQVWGIGLKAEDPRALDPAQWLGTNWLGETLTVTRELFEAKTCGATMGILAAY